MLPFGRQTAANSQTVLNSVYEGDGYTYSNGTSGNEATLPLFTDAPTDLVYAVNTADLYSTANTISNVGLAAQSITWLEGIRTRIDEAVSDIYESIPNNSPYNYSNGAPKSDSLKANARDRILQTIFRHDARYYGRNRISTAYGGNNDYYEYPNRHNYMNSPAIMAYLIDHGIDTVANIDDTGTGGAYRVTSTQPHGLYEGMSIHSNGADTGSAATKKYWLANLYSSISSLTANTTPGSDTTGKFYFNANIGTNYLVDANAIVSGNTTVGSLGGGQIINVTGSDWTPLRWQPPRYFKLTDSNTAFEFYRDGALTDKIYPGYGYVRNIHTGYYNEDDDASGSATGGIAVQLSDSTGASNAVHMMFEDTPQLFQPPYNWTGNVSIYEQKTIANVNPWTGLWTVTSSGMSIYDGQLTNFGGMSAVTGWENIHNLTTPLYFKKISNTTFELYLDEALTTRWDLGEKTGTLTNITYGGVGGAARFTFSDDYVNLVSGQSIYTYNTSTAFSTTSNIANISGSSPETITFTSNHALQNGQPVRLQQDSSVVLYAKTTGFAANVAQLYTSVTWAGSTPSFSGFYSATLGNDIGPAFYVKRVNATTFDCYVDPAMTVPYTVSNSLTGLTTGSIQRTKHITSLTPSAGFIQPMFFCRTEGYYSASLWVDAARTIPYNYWSQNALLTGNPWGGTQSTAQSGVAGTYYINNIGHKIKFGTGSSETLTDQAMCQAYYVKKIDKNKVDLYVEPTLTKALTSPATAAVNGGSFIATYLNDTVDNGRWKLLSFGAINMGAETYYYDSDGDGVDDSIEAQWDWPNSRYYTAHYYTNEIHMWPSVIIEQYTADAAGEYQGRLRNVESSGSASDQGPAIQTDTTTYGGVGTGPAYFNREYPGRFRYRAEILMGIMPTPDAAAPTVASDQVALANTAPEWDTVSNMTDRTIRIWPNTVKPASVVWTIEQPNQMLETQNMNRFVRAKDQTQYRIRATYPPMTRDQFKDFHNHILAARGSFKPFKLILPTDSGVDGTYNNNMFGRIYDRMANTFLNYQNRFRRSANGGTRLIEIDGLPRSRDQADTSGTGELYIWGPGHACMLGDAYDVDKPGYRTQMGSWAVPIHKVESNEYGEANIRLNNGVPTYCQVGTKFYRDAGYLDVFLDGNTIEIKVDARGFHWLEVEFVSKRIF